MMKKLTFAILCIIMSIGLASAQTTQVTGTVTSAEDGEPVVGASVVVKGTTNGTVTDFDGKFELTIPTSVKTLTISFIGMKTKEEPVKPVMNLTLEPANEMLDEVMVVAFGTTTKKSFTGSAAVIKEEDISKRQTSNVTNSIAGQVAGVQGLNSNGQPGTGSKIRIRGIGSMNASNNPLYVVDGIPFEGDISSISNSDIESVTVSKDAASNALYGARGANGVIFINTKRGKTKEAQINVDAKWGSNSRAVPSYDVMVDPGMYYEKFYEGMYNSRYFAGYTAAEAAAHANKNLLNAAEGGLGYLVYTLPEGERLIGTNGKLNPNATLGYNNGSYYLQPDNWYKKLFKSDNLRQEYNLNISGTSDALTYYMSVGYLDDSGIIENSDFQRFSTRLNTEYKAKKWLKVGTNMSYVKMNSKSPGDQTTANSTGNLFYVTSMIAPIYPLYIRDTNGNIMTDKNGFTMYDFGDNSKVSTRPFMSQSNPASAIQLNKEFYEADAFFGKWYAIADIYDGLKATVNFGITSLNQRNQATQNPYYGQFAEMGGAVSVQSRRIYSMNQQYLLSYVKSFGDHNLDVLVGYEGMTFKDQLLWGTKNKLFQGSVPELGNAILKPNTSSSTTKYSTAGILAQVKYDYDSKYFGSVSFRRDASSRFHPDNRWGNFWSVGAGWSMNRESFLEDVEQINMLKLKASFGAQGNDDLGNFYLYTDQYTISENNGEFATTISFKGNRDLTWETSYNFNAGFDFSFFDERLNGTIEGFSRHTEDMLYLKPVSPSLGYSSLPVNVGSLLNAGFEIDLNGIIMETQDLTWKGYVNLTYLKNKILELDPSLGGEWISGNYIYKEGESLYNMYLRKYAGVNETGMSTWYMDVKDANGNVTGQTTTTDWSKGTRYEIGDILPKVYGGFGTSLDFRGIDFSIGLAYQLGGKCYDNTYAALMHAGTSSNAGQNWHKDILKSWTPQNTNTDVPRVNSADQNTNSLSDRFLVSSDYLSLQNITLGYALPGQWLKKAKISKLRIYATAENVALLSARKGLDPRQGFGGMGADVYSPIRSISGGINISF